MDPKEALRQGNNPDTGSGEAGQSKSLVANTYSSYGTDDPDPDKKIDNWGLSEDEVRLAWLVTKGSNNSGTEGFVRDAAATLASSSSHEEWYSQLQINLAHYIGDIMGVSLPNGEEPEGPVPMMEQLDLDGSDLMEFFRENPEEIEHLDSEELRDLADQVEEDEDDEDEE